jgi:hypothetical protein
MAELRENMNENKKEEQRRIKLLTMTDGSIFKMVGRVHPLGLMVLNSSSMSIS